MDQPPTMNQAAEYFGALHWLRAAQAANTLDGRDVAAKIHATPINDFFHDNVPVRANGRVALAKGLL